MSSFEVVMSALTAVYVLTTVFYAITSHKTLVATDANAKALISSERAWVMVELEPAPGYSGPFEGEDVMLDIVTQTTSMAVRIVCKNDGRTPAWITEKRAYLDVVDALPLVPNFEFAQVIQTEPEPLAVGEKGRPKEAGLIRKKGRDAGKLTVIYGIVKYRDVFSDNRTTTFAYKVRVDGALERLGGYPKYNYQT
jgi:hypothetical protein